MANVDRLNKTDRFYFIFGVGGLFVEQGVTNPENRYRYWYFLFFLFYLILFTNKESAMSLSVHIRVLHLWNTTHNRTIFEIHQCFSTFRSLEFSEITLRGRCLLFGVTLHLPITDANGGCPRGHLRPCTYGRMGLAI